jgi:hypothetical protein
MVAEVTEWIAIDVNDVENESSEGQMSLPETSPTKTISTEA